MKRQISLPEETEGKAIPYPRGYEKRLESLMEDMTKAIAKQYVNATFKKLNKKTIEKFEDDQVGNWATVFSTLSNRAKRSINRRFNNDRIRTRVNELLKSLNRQNQQAVYSSVEDEVGISASELIKTEGLNANTNALIQETKNGFLEMLTKHLLTSQLIHLG